VAIPSFSNNVKGKSACPHPCNMIGVENFLMLRTHDKRPTRRERKLRQAFSVVSRWFAIHEWILIEAHFSPLGHFIGGGLAEISGLDMGNWRFPHDQLKIYGFNKNI